MDLIDKILTEWAYRVHDGMPDLKNPLHMVQLKESLNELNLPRKVSEKLLQNLRELDIVKNKKSGHTYDVKTHNPKTQNLVKKDASQSDVDKITKDKDVEKQTTSQNPEDYLQSLNIEVPKGLSDEEIQSIARTEKERRDFINKTIDIMISQVTQQRTGKGTNDLTQEEWKMLQDFVSGKGPKIPPPDGEPHVVTDDDIDDAIERIKSVEGGSKILSAIGNKGSAGKGKNATTRKWVTNPNYDPTKPAGKKGDPPGKNPKDLPGPGLGRERRIIKSFLMTDGLSVVTGKPLSIGAAELDHRLSLDLGGKDAPDNWVWMESRYNQNKKNLSDDELIERCQEWIDKDPEELRADKKAKLIVNEIREFETNHWQEVFKGGSNGGLNEEMLNDMTIPQLKALTNAWTAVNPDNPLNYYQGGDGNRDRGVYMGKPAHIKRILKGISKTTKVLSKEEIEKTNEVLYAGIKEIQNRERDIKV